MKNWRTSLGGFLLAAGQLFVETIQQGHSLTDWKTWIIPFGIAVFGLLVKDFNVAGNGPNATTEPTPPKAIIVPEEKP